MNKYHPIPNWENYGISKDAEVVRLVSCKGAVRGKILKQHLHRTRGYLTVRLYDKERRQTFDVHRLVAMTFIGGIEKGMHVCHIDGNKLNCKASNLRIDTRSSNEMDKVIHGTSNRGERFGRNKYKKEQILEVKKLLSNGLKMKDILIKTNIPLSSIKAISRGANWNWLESENE